MAFNQRDIEPDILATYLHFLMVPGEHELGCLYLYSFLQQVQRTLQTESFLARTLQNISGHIDSKFAGLPDNLSIASKLDLEGVPLELLISNDRHSLLIEIQSANSQSSRLQEAYKNYIRHHPLKAGHRILCLVIGPENYETNNWSIPLRQIDRFSSIRFDGMKDAEPCIKSSIINIFQKYGYLIDDDKNQNSNSKYPAGFLLLEDLYHFISSDLKGYGVEIDPHSIQGVIYLNSSQLEKKSDGYVYIPNGLSGLLRMPSEHIETYKFAFTSNKLSAPGWLSVKRVNSYLKWFLSQSGSDTKAIISRRTRKRYQRGKCTKF